jgi:hypothetical protein
MCHLEPVKQLNELFTWNTCNKWVRCFIICFWVKAHYRVKVGKKEPNSVWIVLKNYFLKIWKITMGTLYIKKIVLFLKKKNYTFKITTTKFSWTFTMFQDSFYMFKTLKKSMWIGGFLYQKSFSFIKCSPNRFNFFVSFNIFHRKGSMCSKHSKNKYTYTFLDFNTRMSFYIIIILNL